jgi:hypothetical protein
LNQFIDSYTILGYFESISLNALEIVKIKIKRTNIKKIFLISNEDCFLLKKEILLDKKVNVFILNQIVNNWDEVEKWTGVAEQMVFHGISKVLINEAENGLFGAVIGEVFQKNEVISYNTMNGMKSGQAQDSYINFDYWFVWDNKMKDILVRQNKLPENKLIVSGHLMEDEVVNYQNKIPVDKLIDKKVISFFSVRDKRQKKIDTLRYLFQLAEQNPQIHLLIRRHPSENEEDLMLENNTLDNVIFVEYNKINSKETLYDQLSISDLSICFGSTVALESKWFGVPCLSIEDRKKSLIYCIDNESIYLAKSITIESLDILINKKKGMQGMSNKSISSIIINYLTNE